MTENSPWRCLLPALILLLLLFMPAAAADESGINSQLPHSSAIAAQNIVSQIRSGQPVSYNNITVAGQLDLSRLEGPIRHPLTITNSRFQGPVLMDGVTHSQDLDLRGSTFQDNVSFARSRFMG
ncbi:MAG: pentapeptide repeat-containing protein, partial [Methanothrix sp.]|nr:pentapeptide repeat-containing protein [Methanothrix sp.]